MNKSLKINSSTHNEFKLQTVKDDIQMKEAAESLLSVYSNDSRALLQAINHTHVHNDKECKAIAIRPVKGYLEVDYSINGIDVVKTIGFGG